MLPSPAQLQPVITDVSEWLSMLAAGATTSPPRAWSSTEWRYARVVAHILGIAPLLHVRGVGASGDAAWREFLAQQYERNTRRNRRILELFDAVQHGATKHGIPLLPLKGVSLITWLYDDVGLRPMSDIDLFTPAAHEAGARALIEAVGFRLVDRIERHGIFVLPPNTVVDLRGEHPENPIKLELHTRLFDNVPREEYDLTLFFTRYCRHVPAGNPASVDVLIHALLHAAVHMMKRSLRFITIYDLYLLSRGMTGAEWQDVRTTLAQIDGAWWAYPPLRLMERYFTDSLRDDVRRWLSAVTTPRLRHSAPRMTMASVSFCNLRPQYVHELRLWSRTFAEFTRYVFERWSGAGRVGWQTTHKWLPETYAYTSKSHPYRRMLRWFSPRAYRGGAEEMFG